jgi:hypothetical protein
LSSSLSQSPLCLYAGRKALEHIKSSGLKPADIKVVAGAAGGPKWLVLQQLDKFLFGEWLANNQEPIHLIGSSIGAWRYAAYCRKDFNEAFRLFDELYFAQRYSENPNQEEITTEIVKVLDGLFPASSLAEIINNKKFKLNLFADRCKGLLNTERKVPLVTGLILSIILNTFSRKYLNLFFKRTLFHHPKDLPPFYNMNDFPTDKVALSLENIRLAVLASGAIPIVIKAVENIPGTTPGLYRDGGLLDYHMSLPYGVDEGIVLLPHFSKTIIPGWLDKFAKIRKPNPKHLENLLLIAPSESFIKSLPLSKIPDRTDFKRFAGDDKGRLAYWREVTRRSQELPDTFQQLLTSGNLLEHIKPFN